MLETQEPKYDAVEFDAGGLEELLHANHIIRLVNRSTDEPIPDDEPIFIFRARDKHARDVLLHYSLLVEDDNHRRVILRRCGEFDQFTQAHPERMKEPDSAPLS